MLFTKNQIKELFHREGLLTAYSGKRKTMFVRAINPKSKGLLIWEQMKAIFSEETLRLRNKFRRELFHKMASAPCRITTATKFKTILI